MANSAPVPVLQFFGRLRWLDGRPLLNVVEPYRQRLFVRFFEERDEAGRLRHNLALCGRAKKNAKTLDAMLAALHAVMQDSPHGSQVYVLTNDEDQARDDLDLLRKLVAANPALHQFLAARRSVVERKDGGGFVQVLPAGDVAGSHGKTYRLLVCDEIHGWRTWDLLEAMQFDPTRADCQQWLTSYASLFHRPGVPLFDLVAAGKASSDARMLFSWFAADFCTDPEFADKSPEERANPSMGTWVDPGYLAQQQRRLPAHKYRRLHLNLPGVPEGSAYQPESVMGGVERGVKVRPPVAGVEYEAFVDMSGGSSDDAVLAIAHRDAEGLAVLDCLEDQGARPPFDPNAAVDRFVRTLRSYRVARVRGDRYAGETFKAQFEQRGVEYEVCEHSKSELYDALEPLLNSHRVVLLDVPTLEQQLLGLVWRGGRIDHPSGEHDDFANACAGVIVAVADLDQDVPLMLLGGSMSAEWERRRPASADDGDATGDERQRLWPLVEALGRAIETNDERATEHAWTAIGAHVERVEQADAAAGRRVRALVARVECAIEEQVNARA